MLDQNAGPREFITVLLTKLIYLRPKYHTIDANHTQNT